MVSFGKGSSKISPQDRPFRGIDHLDMEAEVASAVLSLILAPLSAYFGGKLIGVPYVK